MTRFGILTVVAGLVIGLVACSSPDAGSAGVQKPSISRTALTPGSDGGGGGGY